MPTAPPTLCPRIGCGGKRRAGVCDRCGKVKRPKHTQTTGQRGYDYAWQKFRENYLQDNPLCADCLDRGLVTAATELHHKRKIKDAPHLRLDRANVAGLCGPCHDKRTARGE